MKVTKRDVFGFLVMPRILPQIRSLFGSGFGHIAFYIAQIYGATQLLPPNHPYLNSQNIGRFGVVNVLIEAAHNLRFTRKNIDQIFVFGMMLLGAGLLFAQIFILLFSGFAHMALAAAPTSYTDIFVTANPADDVAHVLIDRVFGIDKDFFNSCVSNMASPCLNSTVVDTYPQPYHLAFHDMLAFYSVGLSVIGIMIFMYYAVVIVVETAQTGVPFGRRFSHVWAPIRIVVAIGLLIPLGYKSTTGLNGAQLLTLSAAKWGSAMATNAWNEFVNTLVAATEDGIRMVTYDPVSGTVVQTNLVAEPQKPQPGDLFRFYTVLATCKQAYAALPGTGISIGAFLVTPDGLQRPLNAATADWAGALAFFKKGAFTIVYGERDLAAHANFKGEVRPYCGEMSFAFGDVSNAATVAVLSGYYEEFIRKPWEHISNNGAPNLYLGAGPPNLPAPSGQPQSFFWDAAKNIMAVNFNPDYDDPNALPPNDHARNAIMAWWDDRIATILAAGASALLGDLQWKATLNSLGWAGAGIWYNKIAELNGALIGGVSSLPTIKKWPEVMENVADEKSKRDKALLAKTLYQPYMSNGEKVPLPGDAGNFKMAEILYAAFKTWEDVDFTEFNGTTGVNKNTSNNAFVDVVNFLFGTKGLFNMRDNADTHPLAQLVVMGKNLLERSVTLLGAAAAVEFAKNVLSVPDAPDHIIQALTSLFRTIGMSTIAIGFVLYYVIPFMPFLYFFFQVGGWIKALFEAMVGLPLWALAHIRIDGHGLAGDAAMSGYFLILEIFLRPILTIFGLVAGISIFAAQVQVLNSIFDLVVSNVTGFDVQRAKALSTGGLGAFAYIRGGIDQLFFTVIYAIIVYLMASASFKLVYLIPNNMLRWMGSSVDGFAELSKDAPEDLVRNVYASSQVMTQQIDGATQSLISPKR